MHCNEMESEAKKIRLFTDSRFKLKSDQFDKTMLEVEKATKAKIELI